MGVRLGQVYRNVRKRGLVTTYRRILKGVSKEATFSIPLRDRVWLSRNGFKPISYVVYEFADKSSAERKLYLPDSASSKQRHINYGPSAFLSNKLVFHRTIERSEQAIRAPELVAIMIRGELLDANKPNAVISFDDVSKRGRDFFVKPLTGGRGRSISRITDGDFAAVQGLLNRSTAHLIVRTVKQADYSNRIFPHTSNTVRAVGMRRPGTREIFFPRAVHRFGSVHTVPVDNWSRGGLSCEIDIDSGVMGPGIRHPSLTNRKLTKFQKHPDTGEQLEDVVIPNWSDARKFVTDLMNLFPEIEFAGWDLLPTEDGWYVIEGNCTMDFDLLQVHRGLLTDDRVREFMIHHGVH